MFYRNFFCRNCDSCLVRYSTCYSHHILGDRGISLNGEFLDRANSTKVLHEPLGGRPRHYTHSDGCCRDRVDKTKVGTCILLVPGRSDKEYDTVAKNSPAR